MALVRTVQKINQRVHKKMKKVMREYRRPLIREDGM